jgi:hypothetical protein
MNFKSKGFEPTRFLAMSSDIEESFPVFPAVCSHTEFLGCYEHFTDHLSMKGFLWVSPRSGAYADMPVRVPPNGAANSAAARSRAQFL